HRGSRLPRRRTVLSARPRAARNPAGPGGLGRRAFGRRRRAFAWPRRTSGRRRAPVASVVGRIVDELTGVATGTIDVIAGFSDDSRLDDARRLPTSVRYPGSHAPQRDDGDATRKLTTACSLYFYLHTSDQLDATCS